MCGRAGPALGLGRADRFGDLGRLLCQSRIAVEDSEVHRLVDLPFDRGGRLVRARRRGILSMRVRHILGVSGDDRDTVAPRRGDDLILGSVRSLVRGLRGGGGSAERKVKRLCHCGRAQGRRCHSVWLRVRGRACPSEDARHPARRGFRFVGLRSTNHQVVGTGRRPSTGHPRFGDEVAEILSHPVVRSQPLNVLDFRLDLIPLRHRVRMSVDLPYDVHCPAIGPVRPSICWKPVLLGQGRIETAGIVVPPLREQPIGPPQVGISRRRLARGYRRRHTGSPFLWTGMMRRCAFEFSICHRRAWIDGCGRCVWVIRLRTGGERRFRCVELVRHSLRAHVKRGIRVRNAGRSVAGGERLRPCPQGSRFTRRGKLLGLGHRYRGGETRRQVPGIRDRSLCWRDDCQDWRPGGAREVDGRATSRAGLQAERGRGCGLGSCLGRWARVFRFAIPIEDGQVITVISGFTALGLPPRLSGREPHKTGGAGRG